MSLDKAETEVRYLSWRQNVSRLIHEARKFTVDLNKTWILTGINFFDVDYDYLVTQSNTFNIPGVEENCHFLSHF